MRTIAFWLSLVLIFTVPWEAIIVFPGLGTLTRAIGVFVAAFWVLTVIVTGRFRKPRAFHIVVYLFLLWTTLSSLWSIDLDGSIGAIQTYFQMAVFALIVWDLFTTPAAVKAALQAYVLGAWVTVGSLVANYLTDQGEWGRYTASGFNANGAALILALGLPVAWHLAAHEADGKVGQGLRLMNYAYIPAAVFAISLTATRFAVVAALPAFLYGFGTLTRLKLFPRVLIFLILVGALFVLPSVIPQSSIERIATIDESVRTGDLGGRLAIWRQGLATFSEHPLLGIGSGAFTSAVPSGRSAHNSFLVVLTQLGIVGFALLAIMLAMTVYYALQQPKQYRGFWLTLLLTWAIGNFALTWLHSKPTWLFLSLVVVSANFTVPYAEQGRRSRFLSSSTGIPRGETDEALVATS